MRGMSRIARIAGIAKECQNFVSRAAYWQPSNFGNSGNLFERLDRGRFVVLNIENSVELRNLQQVVDLLGQIEQFQVAALVTDRSEGTDQLANAGAVNIGDIAKIQKDFSLSFAEEVLHRLAQHGAAFAQGDTAAQVHNSNAAHLPVASLHGHCVSSLFAVLRPTCLINVISVPGRAFLNLTSSIKARMRKIPRPEHFIKFSGAKGSGSLLGSKPGPWSVMVITSASPVVSYATKNFLCGSRALP